MTSIQIKVALMEKRISMRSIAKKLGVSANSVSLVVGGRMVSRRIMEEIAASIDARPAEIFPVNTPNLASPSKVL